MKFLKNILLGIGFSLASLGVLAATFNQFSPATGVLKGNASTYVTTAAVSADIRGLWTGTCNATTFLQGDGACAQVSLSADVTGTLPAANGGTGNTTATDDSVLLGNGTNFVLTSIPNCTDTGGNHLNYTVASNSFSCGTSGGASGANPTGSVGLSAVNGVATTFMRSDASPPLSQSITPTWTSNHVFAAVAVDAAPTVTLSSSLPMFAMSNTSSGVDEKRWDIDVFGPSIFFYSMNDAANNAHTWMRATRSAAAITDVTLGNGTDNPTYTFPSSGTAAFTGDVTVGGSSVCREDGTNCPSLPSGSVVYPEYLRSDGTIAYQAGWSASVSSPGDVLITTDISDSFDCAATATVDNSANGRTVSTTIDSDGTFVTIQVVTRTLADALQASYVNIVLSCK